MKIQAALFYEVGAPISVETIDLEAPHSGEVLVKMVAAGVCHSDWHLVTGEAKFPAPCVMGHEGAGVVEAVGPGVTKIKPGDHIIHNWLPSCGECFYCLHGQSYLCQTYMYAKWDGVMLDKTTRLSKNGKPVYHYSSIACFADYVVVPQMCCVPLSKDVPLTIGALIVVPRGINYANRNPYPIF